MVTQLGLNGRALLLAPISSEEEEESSLPAKQLYNCAEGRLGSYTANHPPYSCKFSGENHNEDNEKTFLRYLKNKKNIDFLSFSVERVTDIEKSDARARVAKLEYSGRKYEYGHRWAVSYKKRFLYRLHLLEDWYRWFDKPVTFLTVTTRQDMSIEDQIMLLKDGFQRIKKKYEKYFGHMTYLAAMDFHRTGYAHYHVVIFDLVKPHFEALMSGMWERRGYGSFEHGLKWKHKKNGEIGKIVNYLFKHSAKVFHLDVPGAMRFHTTVFSMQHCENREYPGVRLFSMSRDIAHVMKIQENESRACLSFQMGENLLYLHEGKTQSEVLEKLDTYKKWFASLNFD